MSDMEELPLHAVPENEQPQSEAAQPPSLAGQRSAPRAPSPFPQGADASWDPIWAHAHLHPAHKLASLQCDSAASEGGSSSEQLLAEWEVLTEPGTPMSACGSPARCATPPQPEGVALHPRPATLQMTAIPGGGWAAQPFGTVSSPLATAPASAAPMMAGTGSQAAAELMQAPATVTSAPGGSASPGARSQASAGDDGGASLLGSAGGSSIYSGSLDSADHLDSPYSADLVMASVEAFQRSHSQQHLTTQPTIPAQPLASRPIHPDDLFVHGALGERLSALWEWLEAVGSRAGRWTSCQLAALHSYVVQLGAQPFLAGFPPDSLRSFASGKAGGAPRNPLARTVLVQGAVCVALAAALAVCLADNRRLAGRLRQKDGELAALIMKVFSLQESLQGARTLPVICHAMTPIKHPLDGYL